MGTIKSDLKETNVFERNLIWVTILGFVLFWILIRILIPGTFIGNFWFLIISIIVFLRSSIIKIPSKPSHTGILTILGEKRNSIVKEGNKFLRIPFISNVIKIKLEKITKTFTYKDIKCVLSDSSESNNTKIKSGGTVEAVVDVVIIPDKQSANRLAKFIDSGGETGVLEIIDGIIGETLRQTGADTTWEQMQFANNWLSMLLITRLTGKTPRIPIDTRDTQQESSDKLYNNYNNDELYRNAEEEKYKELACSRNPVVKACITRFITGEIINGIPDSKELGILISRLNVKNITPSGKLKEESERAAIEEQQKRAELKDVNAIISQAEKLKNTYDEAGETITMKECIKKVIEIRALNENNAQIFRFEGGNSVDAVISNILTKNKKGG